MATPKDIPPDEWIIEPPYDSADYLDRPAPEYEQEEPPPAPVPRRPRRPKPSSGATAGA